jgi:hypothetical protein
MDVNVSEFDLDKEFLYTTQKCKWYKKKRKIIAH